jgi:AcrR family transcriptional regulator
MSGTPNADSHIEVRAPEGRVALRRKRVEDEIVAAAWDLVHHHGLASLSMRDLGERVGMKAQSIYSYFASKNDIYDAMFREGQIAFSEVQAAAVDASGDDESPAAVLRVFARAFFDFATSDPVRYQLMFQRVIPDFVPSPASYEIAVDTLDRARARMQAAGFDPDRDLDMWTALLSGLADQQLANDPGGNRWGRLIDDAVDMFVSFATTKANTKTKTKTKKGTR